MSQSLFSFRPMGDSSSEGGGNQEHLSSAKAAAAPGPESLFVSELDVLVAEQERDSRSFKVFGISVDAFPSGVDFIYRKSRKLASDPRHGTLSCYTNLACRCDKCKEAAREAKRDWRQRNRIDRGPYSYRICCQECGSENVKRQRVYG